MQVVVVYALSDRACSAIVELDPQATVDAALTAAAQLPEFKGIDLTDAVVGIFGVLASRAHSLTEGDRVEIYRPLRTDAKTERRARVVAARKRARS